MFVWRFYMFFPLTHTGSDNGIGWEHETHVFAVRPCSSPWWASCDPQNAWLLPLRQSVCVCVFALPSPPLASNRKLAGAQFYNSCYIIKQTEMPPILQIIIKKKTRTPSEREPSSCQRVCCLPWSFSHLFCFISKRSDQKRATKD